MGKTKSKKKILIYSPYWSILGGGERYLLQIAAALGKKHRVFLVSDKHIIKRAGSIFAINLKNIEILPEKLITGQKFYSRYFFTRQFDVCFYLTDGSLFFPGAGKNYLIIQSPSHIPRIDFSNRLKISGWKIICYSSFMQNIIQKNFNRSSIALPPAVDTSKLAFNYREDNKEKIFLTVGRFFKSDLHEKKADFLIDFFSRFHKKYFPLWKLLICGNLTENSGLAYVNYLRKIIKSLPVELQINLSFSRLADFYSRSSIYWHAAGVGLDAQKYPEKMEHFGITTLEAMASGCVPLSYAAGGQIDIIENNKSGFLWHNDKDFLKMNLKLINNKQLRLKMAKQAVRRASDYSFNNFKRKVNELV